jgi:hypothetical protein
VEASNELLCAELGNEGGNMRRTTGSYVRLGAIAASLLLAGCYWTLPGQNTKRQAHNASEDAIGVDTVASLTQKWQATVDGGAVGDPVTSSVGVHAADPNAVYGFDTGSGVRNWKYAVADGLVRQPRVHGDTVRFGEIVGAGTAANASTVDVDAATGGVEIIRFGFFPLADGVSTEPTELRYHVSCVQNCPGLAGVFSAAMIPPPDLRQTRYSVMKLNTNQTVCCGVHDGLTVGVPNLREQTLAAGWFVDAGQGVVDLASPANAQNGIRGVDIAHPQACAPPNDIYGLCPAWALQLDGTTATIPVLSDDESTAYVGTDTGSMWAVEVATGAVLWQRSSGGGVTDSPALANGSLYVPTVAGQVVVLDAATGDIQWVGDTGSEVTQQPAVAGGVVFAGSANGAVTAFDAAGCGVVGDCPPLWSATTGSRITGAPAVSQGRLYVGTQDGRLISYGL